jgi:uncharacterized protein YmfQ (DUF2313 family)
MAALSAADYAKLIEDLTPKGPAWTENRIRAIWAEEYARLDTRIWALIEEVDPRTASELLSDWERVLGLPDECMASIPLSINERRLIAWQRLTELGGQSRAYFIDLAARFGEPGVTISEFRQMTCNDDCNDALYSLADAFTWRVNFPHPAENVRLMNCNDDCNDALQMFTPALAECPITERKPAHTSVIFSYQ